MAEVFEYDNGDTYTGEADGNVREGYGIYTSGSVKIEGVWHNNQLNGNGKMITPDFTYEGEFVNSVRQGYGVEIHKTFTYEGLFDKGLKNGKAKLKLNNGCVVDCCFVNGKGVGYGQMTMTDGEVVKVEFKDGNMYFCKE